MPALGIEMKKVEAYNKAWRLGIESNDFSLADEIYHPDFKAVDAVSKVEVNIDSFEEAPTHSEGFHHSHTSRGSY